MDTIFLNNENSERFEPYMLLVNLLHKIKLKRTDKYLALSNLSMYYTWKNIKRSYKYNKYHVNME